MFKLPTEHFHVKGADAVKVVALGANLNLSHETSRFMCLQGRENFMPTNKSWMPHSASRMAV